MSTVPAGLVGDECVAPDHPNVVPMLLRPTSHRAIAVAPIRAPLSSRRNAVICGAIAISNTSPSRSTHVPVSVTDWPNCPGGPLSYELKETLYSVRPHQSCVPRGVYLIAVGSSKPS